MIAPSVASAQFVHEKVMVGARAYYLYQQPFPDPPEFVDEVRVVATPDGGCVMVYIAESLIPIKQILLQAIDSWGRRTLGPIPVDFDEYRYVSLTVLPVGEDYWVAWGNSGGAWFRIVDSDGAVTPRRQLDASVEYAEQIALATNNTIVAAVYDSLDDPTPPFGVSGRLFTPDGTPLTGTLPIGHDAGGQAFWGGTLAFGADATILYAYDCFFPHAARGTRFRFGGSDGWLDAPFDAPSRFPYGWIVSPWHGGYMFVSVDERGSLSTGVTEVFWLDPNAAVLRQTNLVSDYFGLASNGAGEFAVMYARNPFNVPELLVSLYDSDGTQIVNRLQLFRPPAVRTWSASRCFALADNGAMWIRWRNPAEMNENYITLLRPISPGDLNADDLTNGFDVDPFVLALTSREAYQAAFPHIPPEAIDILGDMNGDGLLNNFDIDPFVDALVNGP
ncbi:MAG: hypothetical protein HRU75_01280 [Planctomycetia bacterium]|nr:MAG: hypothetical protein HRU75_01280 [Planctomycetia bacterium]